MACSRCLVLFFALVFVLFGFCVTEAKEFVVGDSENAWKIPVNSSDSLNQWAAKKRFKVGDILIIRYDAKVDSVLQVTKEDYDSCKTSKPIKAYKDGYTNVKLDKSGPFNFISGADGHCQKGQKLVVVVMSEKHDHSPSPSPSTTPVAAPPQSAATHHLPLGLGASLFAIAAFLLGGL